MALADDLIAVLDDPTHMWSHALKELSADGQRLFLTLTLLPNPISSDVLQIAYTSLTPNRSETFIDSLRSLEDSFVDIERYYADIRVVRFRNPSLEDFAKAYLDKNTDWLDILLSAPRYCEQIVSVFSLAMAQTAHIVNADDGSPKSAPAKYLGIKGWVEHRTDQLIEFAVNLLNSERILPSYARSSRKSRLGELLEIIATYGAPTRGSILDELQSAVTAATKPASEYSAEIMIGLLRRPVYRRLLDTLLDGNAAAMMRENILDKDTWKFAILSKIDKLLALDLEESWDSWGNDYMDYARELAESLSVSTDYDDLHAAIEELTGISSMLDADLYDEIRALERQRDSLPEADDYNDSGSRLQKAASESDESAELDVIFASLL
jgi:hypothetical protein